MQKQDIQYVKIKEYRDEKATVRVYRPILTEEERERRMKNLRRAAETILKTAIRLEMEQEKAAECTK
ncbi:MAG: hypothetical protein ACI4TA_04395 [Acetatifactor sp.]